MGKALMGAYATPRTVQLLDEVRALRQRVAQLEQALAEAEAVRDRRVIEAEQELFGDDQLVTLDEAAAVSH